MCLVHHAGLAPHLHHTLDRCSRVQRMSLATEGGLISSSQPLQMVYRHFQSTWRPMRMSLCPHTHLGAPQVIYLENKGPTPCPLLLGVLFHIMAPLDFTSHHLRPNDSCCTSFSPLQRLTLLILSQFGGLVTKRLLFCTLFYFRGSIRPHLAN